MGKLDHDPHIQHFSHPHTLYLHNSQDNITPQNTPSLCSSCKYPQSGFMYSCNHCNFHIHLSCTQFPQLITHPSHPSHALTLLPVSSYPGGLFDCDACNRRGDGFSYHCHHCDFDLHVVCAAKPLTVQHRSHAHALCLTFRNPYESIGFSCDICKKIGSKQWIYRCGACEFDAHLDCATGTRPVPQPKPVAQLPAVQPKIVPPQPHLLQTQSFPGAIGQHNQFRLPMAPRRISQFPGTTFQPNQAAVVPGNMNQFSGTAVQPNLVPTAVPERMNQYPVLAHSASTGNWMQQQPAYSWPAAPQQQQQSYASTSANSFMGNGLMGMVVQGVIEGAAQQVGQDAVQKLFGGGGNNGGGGNGSSSSGGNGDGFSWSNFVDTFTRD